MSIKSLSLVVPVYNEAEVIEQAVRIFLSDLEQICGDCEIVVVDDGSTDGTLGILKRLSAQDARVRVIVNEKNLGSGLSLWRGMRAAAKDLVLTNFADRPFDLKDADAVLAPLASREADVVVVARRDRSANSFYRKLTSLTNYWLIRSLFGVSMGDFQFVQAYRKAVLQDIELISTGTFVPPELLIRLVDRGAVWREVVCPFHRRTAGAAKCGRLSVIMITLREMFAFWVVRRRNRGKRP
jgi:glycosyltransferase involved in cell wall biosynthesis